MVKANGDPSLATAARELREARDAFRDLEGGFYAGAATTMAEAAERLVGALERVQWAGRILTPEQAAIELGFVDAQGRSKTKAFAKMAAECGFRRHVANRTNIYYLRDELLEDVRGLPG